MADGIFDLPAGKIAAVATYLQMAGPPEADDVPVPEGGRFEPLAGDLGRYRALYAEVGRDWLWFSRALMPNRDLAAIVDHPQVEALALVIGGRDVGMVEVDFRKPGDCELAFLGLVRDATGRGLGRVLVAEAIRRAFGRRIDRLWLHTCTLDHPDAVRFYLRAGFEPYRRAIEIADDPRIKGALPADCAPHFPSVY